MQPGRGAWWRDLGSGVRSVHRAVFALLHERALIGQLGLPVASNLLVFGSLVLVGAVLLAPWFTAFFGGTWWLLDGWRASFADAGPGHWLLTSWLLLGPPLLDVLAGPFQEPLRRAAEAVMLGPARERAAAPRVRRVRERAQVLAGALLLWPLALFVSLLPWIGLPLVVTLGAVSAAVVWFEPPMAARGLGQRRRLQALWQNRWRALGVGVGLQLAAAVPFVNVLALAPVATLAATSAYLQFDKRDPIGPARGSAAAGG
ncbi:MAG: EI24 domain-containing protein [Planctomycetes bacterium]|nr:EI24 domain-containing protein [Planctomycetota bacterium]